MVTQQDLVHIPKSQKNIVCFRNLLWGCEKVINDHQVFRKSQKLLRGNSTPEKQPSVWDACSPVLFYCFVFGYCYIDPLTYSCDVIILPPRKIPLNFNNRKYFLKLSFPKWHQGAFSLEVFTHSCVIILQVLLQIQYLTPSSTVVQLKRPYLRHAL